MALSRRGAALALLVLAFAVAAGAAAERIGFVTEGDGTAVEVHGVDPALLDDLRAKSPDDPAWPRLLAVRTLEADAADGKLPGLLGAYSVQRDGVRFVPRFRLVPGKTYVARWRKPAAGRGLSATYTVPGRSLEPTTRLLATYPSATLLPENLLRLYLQFSGAMSRGRASRHVRLLDEAGSVVEAPFVAPERELWSPDHTRLTLFFDPGRIKRGVGPNSEVGPPLEAGRTYTLVVDREFPDARGAPLASGYTRSFGVGAADREQPGTGDWDLEAPATARDPVTLRFPETLDRGLLDGLLWVLDDRNQPVEGRTVVPAGEREWSFYPRRAWSEGVYRIRVETELEDVAGNSLRRPFEVVLGGGDAASTGPRFVDLEFRVRPPARPSESS